MRCIHRHVCIHSAFYGVHSQYIERTALHVIIMHLWFFAFLVVTFRRIWMHSGLSAFSSCCIHVHSPAPIHSHTFREGCIITTVHSSYMYTHSMIVHFYRHALLCIYDSLHFWLLHSVAFRCILAYLHSRPCAYRCMRSHSMTRCILVFGCIRIHSNAQNSHTF